MALNLFAVLLLLAMCSYAVANHDGDDDGDVDMGLGYVDDYFGDQVSQYSDGRRSEYGDVRSQNGEDGDSGPEHGIPERKSTTGNEWQQVVDKFKVQAKDLETEDKFHGLDEPFTVNEQGISAHFHDLHIKQLSHFTEKTTQTTLEMTYNDLKITGKYTMKEKEKKATGTFSMSLKKVIVTYELEETKLKFRTMSVHSFRSTFFNDFERILKAFVNDLRISLLRRTFVKKIRAETETALKRYFESIFLKRNHD